MRFLIIYAGLEPEADLIRDASQNYVSMKCCRKVWLPKFFDIMSNCFHCPVMFK